jgi:hypothetical protein
MAARQADRKNEDTEAGRGGARDKRRTDAVAGVRGRGTHGTARPVRHDHATVSRPSDEPRSQLVDGPTGREADAASLEGTHLGRSARRDLTPQQIQGINALFTQPTMTAAAASIGVHPRTLSRWLQEPAVLSEYEQMRVQLQLETWHGLLAMRQEALARFRELVHSKDERVALRATTWLIERTLTVPSIPRGADNEPRSSAPSVSPRLQAFLDQPGIEREENASP